MPQCSERLMIVISDGVHTDTRTHTHTNLQCPLCPWVATVSTTEQEEAALVLNWEEMWGIEPALLTSPSGPCA